jgi:hypothetical protein
MMRRTIPRAGTRKRHAYYDWDQRPCSLTSFAQAVAQRTNYMSAAFTRGDVLSNRLKPHLMGHYNRGYYKKTSYRQYSTLNKHWTRVIVYVVRLVICVLCTLSYVTGGQLVATRPLYAPHRHWSQPAQQHALPPLTGFH